MNVPYAYNNIIIFESYRFYSVLTNWGVLSEPVNYLTFVLYCRTVVVLLTRNLKESMYLIATTKWCCGINIWTTLTIVGPVKWLKNSIKWRENSSNGLHVISVQVIGFSG